MAAADAWEQAGEAAKKLGQPGTVALHFDNAAKELEIVKDDRYSGRILGT